MCSGDKWNNAIVIGTDCLHSKNRLEEYLLWRLLKIVKLKPQRLRNWDSIQRKQKGYSCRISCRFRLINGLFWKKGSLRLVAEDNTSEKLNKVVHKGIWGLLKIYRIKEKMIWSKRIRYGNWLEQRLHWQYCTV